MFFLYINEEYQRSFIFLLFKVFYDHYINEGVVEVIVRDCIFNVLSRCDHTDENLRIKVLGIIDELSLIGRYEIVETFVYEISNLRIALSRFLCLEILDKEEAEKNNKSVETINDKNPLQDKERF